MSKAAELAALIGSGQAQGDRNLIINGAMTVAQRGDTTGISNANSGYYGPDRFKFNEDGTMTAVVSIAQETLTSGGAFNSGHLGAYKLSVTTADTAVAADIYTRITHRFEKNNLAALSKGSSSAKAVTLSFWVKATVTGTNVVEFFDQVNSRQVGATYAISSSNTWEYKTVKFPADTSGALGSGNALAAEINFVLQAGSNYTSGTLDTSWASETAANRAAGHNSNHFSSTSNTFHFTGVQLEVGDVATPFEHEDFGTTLRKCERYFQKSYEYGTSIGTNTSVGCLQTRSSGTGWIAQSYLTTRLRAHPTTTSYSTDGTSGKIRDFSGSNNPNANIGADSESSINISASVGGDAHSAGAQWTMDAEL